MDGLNDCGPLKAEGGASRARAPCEAEGLNRGRPSEIEPIEAFDTALALLDDEAAFDGVGSSSTSLGKGASKTLDAVAEGAGLKLYA